ncbi:MAG: TetR family transcriptional regulator [Deltaproteobacteria bacterium]|nr:TetR family transcriptional regulator [Deltaproteobacteria bacterium]
MDNSRKELTVLDQITNPDKVRKKIIDAASVLYAKKGFADTSIEEISETAGVSLSVANRYVRKKSEIMRMIMEDVITIFKGNLVKMIEGIDDPEEKLAVAIHIYFRVVNQQREKVLLIYQKSGSLDKASKSRIMELEVEVSNIFAKIIHEGIELGAFKRVDVDLTAYNILLMAHMWVLKRWHFKDRLTHDRYFQLQLENVMGVLRE